MLPKLRFAEASDVAGLGKTLAQAAGSTMTASARAQVGFIVAHASSPQIKPIVIGSAALSHSVPTRPIRCVIYLVHSLPLQLGSLIQGRADDLRIHSTAMERIRVSKVPP